MAEAGPLDGVLGPEGDEREIESGPLAADAIATAVAMDAARHDPELARKAGDYLDEQRALVRLQVRCFDEDRRLSTQAARRKRFSDRLRTAGQVFLAVVAFVVAFAAVGMVWAAAHDHGLVVEAFSVPPDLAQRGLTGQVVAKQVLDQLADMQSRTESTRAASSYSNNWGDDLKVEIPETGVSLGEVRRSLSGWLGHPTRISGEVIRTPARLTLTARAGESGAKSFSGPDADFDRLVQGAAEAVYARTQPYRYSQYLIAVGRPVEALAVMTALVRSPDRRERAWAHSGLGTLDLELGGDAAADAREQRAALGEVPAFRPALGDLALAEFVLGHDQEAVRAANRFLAAPRSSTASLVSMRSGAMSAIVRLDRALIQGDTPEAILQMPHFLGAYRSPIFKSLMKFPLSEVAYASAMGHDPSSMRVALATLDAHNPYVSLASGVLALGADDPSAVAILGQLRDSLPGIAADYRDPFLPRTVTSWLAIAKARFGDPAGARALIATAPVDCYLCVRARGIIAAAGDRGEAERWFAEAIRQGPELPQAFVDRGSARLSWGDAPGAIADARAASKLSTHYADAPKLWGDALARQGRWADALARYDAALTYAPAWSPLRRARDAAARHVG
jgi:tetratricopeptide (TPR) repeat protein